MIRQPVWVVQASWYCQWYFSHVSASLEEWAAGRRRIAEATWQLRTSRGVQRPVSMSPWPPVGSQYAIICMPAARSSVFRVIAS